MTSDNSTSTPLIIPRSEHSISRNNIDREALKVLHRLKDAGFTAYLVGGGVRDLLLGKKPKDFDISTDAHPGQLKKIFRNSRIIGRRFRLVQVFFHGDKIIEVATFRCRSEYDVDSTDEVLASNNTFGTPIDDAFRRDLTINGLFYEIENFSVIDYVGGVKDINAGIIRIIGDPDRRITRDPARMMRAIRHAARSGFEIEEKTWEAIKRHKQMLSLCPVSRIRDEMFKDLRGGAASRWAGLAIDCGLFPVIFPFYDGIGDDNNSSFKAAEDYKKVLLDLLAVVDRLGSQGQDLEEPILLAMLLTPWAMAKMDLFTTVRQGKELFEFSRQIRQKLDTILQHLNIKRSSKEAIATLLANLPVFMGLGGKDWPKWLARKSYFPKCKQFYHLYREAKGGEEALISRPPVAEKQKTKDRPNSSHSPRRRSIGGPAFATNTKGGVFGFRK